MSGEAEENGEEMNEGGKIMEEVTMSDIMGRRSRGQVERSYLIERSEVGICCYFSSSTSILYKNIACK